MRFASPEILWLSAILLPLLALFLVLAWRKKQRLIAQFVQSRLLSNLTVGVSHARQKLRLVLLFFATVFALLALARPQWGFDWQEAHQQGLDVIVAIDTSKSMLAADISPNRLTRAKLAALDLMKLAQSDRLGVVAFAGTAFLQCPLTLDEEAFRQSIDALDANIIPQGGTALAEAIDAAVGAFEKSENHKVLVLFTDGEDQDSGAIDAADKAAKAHLKIFTIGVGTREGELLRVRDDRGNLVYLKDDAGNAVKSRLNETLLQEVATKGSGFYLPLVGANPMEALYREGLARLPKSESATKLVKNYRERFKWPLGLAIAMLIFEMFLPQQRRVRKSSNPEPSNGLGKAITAIALLLTITAGPAHASISSAARSYEEGKFAEAFADYQELITKKTNDFRLYYNAGDAAYKAGHFDVAKKHFDVALQSPDLNLQQQAYYNLGNTLYEIGAAEEDPNNKREPWEAAVNNYEAALKLNSADADARHNLAFVKKKLEELKQQQQQQQKQDQSKQDDKDKEDKEQKNEDQKNSQEQQDSAKNDEQKKQDQQKQDSAKQDQKDQQQKENEQKKAEQKKNQQQEQDQKQQQANQPEPGKEGEEDAQAVAAGQMSIQQALQFLEAQKQQDRTLIFAPPPDQKPKNPNAPLKDW